MNDHEALFETWHYYPHTGGYAIRDEDRNYVASADEEQTAALIALAPEMAEAILELVQYSIPDNEGDKRLWALAEKLKAIGAE